MAEEHDHGYIHPDDPRLSDCDFARKHVRRNYVDVEDVSKNAKDYIGESRPFCYEPRKHGGE